MRKIFAVSALSATLVLAACAAVDTGKVVDKVREPGSTEIKCTGKGVSKKCKTDVDPEKCMFQLNDGRNIGWKEVDCSTTFQEYSVGEQYPRN